MIDEKKIIHTTLYDDEHEEWIDKEMTIKDYLDAFTDEGCPQASASKSMTIRDLLRVTDYNGDDEELLFKIMDGNGNVRVIFHTNCDLLWELGDKVINSINVAHAKVLEIWLEDEKDE